MILSLVVLFIYLLPVIMGAWNMGIVSSFHWLGDWIHLVALRIHAILTFTD